MPGFQVDFSYIKCLNNIFPIIKGSAAYGGKKRKADGSPAGTPAGKYGPGAAGSR